MLKQQLQKDQIAAMKAGDKETLGVLRYIVSQIKNKEIDTRQELTEEEVVQVLQKQVKQLKEGIASFEQGGRTDLIEENQKQITIIQKYLPAEITDEEIETEVDRLVSENQDKIAANPKAAIGICMNELRSKADPARISAVLKKKNLL